MDEFLKYKNRLAWRALIGNVLKIQDATDLLYDRYQLPIKPIDINENGANFYDITTDCFLRDNVGHIYSIVEITDTKIIVDDILRCGFCPNSGFIGVLYSSAYKGFSIALSQDFNNYLDNKAISYTKSIENSIIWQNDPNTRVVAFNNVNAPSIANYRGKLIDINGVEFIPMEDYGQNPKFEVYQKTEDGKYSRMNGTMEHQIIRSLIDGLIDSINWSGTGELITGYYTISH